MTTSKLPPFPEKPDEVYGTAGEWADYSAGMTKALAARMEALAAALKELRALVWGECPSLLDEDSGGDSRLDMEIEDALTACARKEAGR